MTMNFQFEETIVNGANIKVVGVGGAGGNALNNMVRNHLHGVHFVAVNTDMMALDQNQAAHKVQIGKELTRGLGAGANPERGWHAAMENKADIARYLEGADMVFVTAGLGGGTGTGAAPLVAQVARELGALTVAVVTKPFEFEGKPRMRNALKGLEGLRDCVDTYIVIPNDRLLGMANPNMSLIQAFREADNVLYNAVKGISDLITTPGLVQLDFADVRTIMREQGMALMGAGQGKGKDRAVLAAKQAISSPLLEDTSIDGAMGILINVTGGEDMSLMEMNDAIRLVQEAAHEDANIIFGAVIDKDLEDEVHITVVATGFDRTRSRGREEEAEEAEILGTYEEMDGKMVLPPVVDPYAQPEYVTQSAGHQRGTRPMRVVTGGGGGGEPQTRQKPWDRGGRKLVDLLSGGGEPQRPNPFETAGDSEYGPGGYPKGPRRG